MSSLKQQLCKDKNFCPICKTKDPWVESEAELVRECRICSSTSKINFRPMWYQTKIVYDNNTFLSVAGAYATGKTVTLMYKHLLAFMKVPHSDSLLLANTLEQLDNTSFKELKKMLPRKLVWGDKKLPNVKSKGGEILLSNNHRILFSASNNENKLRSLTLLLAHIEESNGVDESIYNQLTARIRASSDGDPDLVDRELVALREKYQQVSITTNTDDGWTYDEAIGRDMNIKNYTPYDLPKSPRPTDEMFSSYIIPTRMNRYLSDTFIKGLKARYSDVEYEIMVNARYGFKMGRIVRNIDDIVVENLTGKIENLDKMPYMYGLDFGQGGQGDDQALVKARVDFKNHMVYIVGEYPHTQSRSIDEKVSDYFESGFLSQDGKDTIAVLYDKINGNKRGYADLGNTLADMYREAGVIKMEAGDNGSYGVNDRVDLLLQYVSQGRLFIDSKCEYLISQIRGWSWDPKKSGKPTDKDNHGIDAMVFILLRLGYIHEFQQINYSKFLDRHARHDDVYSGTGNLGFMNRLGVGKRTNESLVRNKTLYDLYT